MYRRGNILSKELDQFVNDELQEIERAFGFSDFLRMKELHEEPAKLLPGLIVFADGTDWDPGSGQGIYAYYNGAWNKLG